MIDLPRAGGFTAAGPGTGARGLESWTLVRETDTYECNVEAI